MGLQLIFCVETKNNNGSDWVYINETINHYYQRDKTIKITKVTMNGKMGLTRPKVQRKVGQLIREFGSAGKTSVICCVDTDDWNTDPQRQKDWKTVSEFCADKGYELVWFCRTIEEVYIGNQIDNSAKLKQASQFRRSNSIKALGESRLNQKKVKERYSNILLVLDQYLQRI